MTAAQLAAIFIGGIAGYFAVSALIDRSRHKTGSEPDANAKPAAAPPTTELPASSEPPKPARSVWEEMNGGGSSRGQP